MRVNFRCTNKQNSRDLGPRCGKRDSRDIEKHSDVSDLKCRYCGGNLKPDYEVYRRHKRENCWCSGIPFTPHRAGTIMENGMAVCIEITDEELQDWLWRKHAEQELGGVVRKMKPDEECPF